MERKYSAFRPEDNFDLDVIFDEAVKRETDHHPELNSRRKKLIFIQETFQWWNPVELGRVIGVDEKTVRRFLSRRGIRNNEYEQIAESFEGTFAITSIIEHHIQGLLERRDTLVKPNALLDNLGAKEMLKRRQTKKALAVVERSYGKFHEEN